ncbi:very short patch repair endonuclease [Geodermatophilus sp. SYSU D00698]
MPTADDGGQEAGRPMPLNAGRSRNMQANRRVDSRPERLLRSALHARGYRFRKDLRLDLPNARVRPDIVFTRRKVAVFVDGCFWHVCPQHGRQPDRNQWYWSPKLQRNVERDRRADSALKASGWTVVRVWEHETLEAALQTVLQAVDMSGTVRTATDTSSGPLIGEQGRPRAATPRAIT